MKKLILLTFILLSSLTVISQQLFAEITDTIEFRLDCSTIMLTSYPPQLVEECDTIGLDSVSIVRIYYNEVERVKKEEISKYMYEYIYRDWYYKRVYLDYESKVYK